MNREQKKVILWIGLAAVVSVGAMVACLLSGRGDNEPKEASATSAVVATATPAPTEDPHKNMERSRLTGMWVSKAVSRKRPVAVMINNIEYAFENQAGTSRADIIYEALAEGGISRMMAIYENIDGVKKIGSVRSARHYYVQFAKEWDAIYCHFGHTKYATAKINKLKTDNLSGLSGIGPVVYARTSRLQAPHNVFTSDKQIKKGIKKLHYSTKRRPQKMAEHFDFLPKDITPENGKNAKKVVLPFSYYSICSLKYQPKTKKYLKYEYGKKHRDRYYKKQLSFKNIIVQLVAERNIDRNGYQTMSLSNNTGKGYYITDGRQIPIRWERKESNNTMRYFDEDGNLLRMNPGKTYIAVFPKNRQKMIRIK